MPGKAAWLATDLPFEGELGPEARAGALADRGVPTCRLGEVVGDIADHLGAAGLCVVVEEGVVVGLLTEDALAAPSRTAGEAMRPGPSTFRPSIPIGELTGYLDDHHLDFALITTLDGRLSGVVRRTSLPA